jgi:hypothetical protein
VWFAEFHADQGATFTQVGPRYIVNSCPSIKIIALALRWLGGIVYIATVSLLVYA